MSFYRASDVKTKYWTTLRWGGRERIIALILFRMIEQHCFFKDIPLCLLGQTLRPTEDQSCNGSVHNCPYWSIDIRAGPHAGCSCIVAWGMASRFFFASGGFLFHHKPCSLPRDDAASQTYTILYYTTLYYTIQHYTILYKTTTPSNPHGCSLLSCFTPNRPSQWIQIVKIYSL